MKAGNFRLLSLCTAPLALVCRLGLPREGAWSCRMRWGCRCQRRSALTVPAPSIPLCSLSFPVLHKAAGGLGDLKRSFPGHTHSLAAEPGLPGLPPALLALCVRHRARAAWASPVPRGRRVRSAAIRSVDAIVRMTFAADRELGPAFLGPPAALCAGVSSVAHVPLQSTPLCHLVGRCPSFQKPPFSLEHSVSLGFLASNSGGLEQEDAS